MCCSTRPGDHAPCHDYLWSASAWRTQRGTFCPIALSLLFCHIIFKTYFCQIETILHHISFVIRVLAFSKDIDFSWTDFFLPLSARHRRKWTFTNRSLALTRRSEAKLASKSHSLVVFPSAWWRQHWAGQKIKYGLLISFYHISDPLKNHFNISPSKMLQVEKVHFSTGTVRLALGIPWHISDIWDISVQGQGSPSALCEVKTLVFAASNERPKGSVRPVRPALRLGAVQICMRLSVLKFTENSSAFCRMISSLRIFGNMAPRMFAPNSYETGFKMFQTALREAVVGCCGALCLALTTHEIRDTRSSRHPQLSTAEATAMPCLCCPARYHCQFVKNLCQNSVAFVS